MCTPKMSIAAGEQKATPYSGPFSALQNRMFKLKYPRQTVSDKTKFESWRSGIRSSRVNQQNVRYTPPAGS